MNATLRPEEALRQRLREGAYAEVRDEILAHGKAASGINYQACLTDALAQLRDWAGAIAVAEAHQGRHPYFSALLIAQLHQNAGEFEDCWRWLDRARANDGGETLAWLNTACKAAAAQGDRDRAQAYGQKVLAERDRRTGPSTAICPIAGGTHKVVAFTLFGTGEIYWMGALANARLWRQMAPDWQCWFYVAPDVPQGVSRALAQMGARVGRVKDPAIPAYMARFLVLQDRSIARFICRDVDCRPTEREIEILREWEASPCRFHVIRNNLVHTDLVLAGLWGGVPVEGFDLAREIAGCFPRGATNKYGSDQRFLEHRLWTRMRSSLLMHDEHYRLDGIETRAVGDPNIGGGYQDARMVRREAAKLGIRIEPPMPR